jgi:hypothetical protein
MSLTSEPGKKTVEQNAATHRVITKQFSDTNQLIWRNNTHIRIPSKKKRKKRRHRARQSQIQRNKSQRPKASTPEPRLIQPLQQLYDYKF